MKLTAMAGLGAATLLCARGALADLSPGLLPPQPEDAPLAGFHDGFFLRDQDDNFRLYPRGRINIDMYGFAGPGVSQVKAADGSTALAPRLFFRRVRLELAGDFFHQLASFWIATDFGGQPLSNSNGKTEQTFSKAGQAPTSSTAHFAPIQSASTAAALADVWLNIQPSRALGFMIGQYQAPFSMENRTSESYITFMERNVAIRGFAFPSGKETGVTAWGEVGDGGVFNYEVGVFGGDGQNRPQVDSRFDFMGRVFVKPLAGAKGGALQKLQIGASAHHGDRDPTAVGYDYPQVTSQQGWVLWDSTYKNTAGRTVHILPSGAQNEVGGELRIPIQRFDLRGEAYYLANGTREAIEGYQLTNTERYGTIRGVAWYGQLSFWPWGTPFVQGDPGYTRPRHVDLNSPEEYPQGIEVAGLVAGVNAHYDGASRQGARDASTPNSAITLYQVGGGVNYWATRFFRVALNYFAYVTPSSGDTKQNQAVVPGNIAAAQGAHVLHEISGRFGVQF